ncbi:MAG: hypothetical protein IJG38_00045 [Thermoguttaceae bacterium]|nr:hypothetical protein [Thermoguttaceae bacterium]MBQ6617323.1 hypothetical protein [Thermoguttaceae bacterium]
MKKHVWEYFFKDEEELEKQWWYFTARDAENITVGCFAFLLLIAMLFFGILLIVSLFTIKL